MSELSKKDCRHYYNIGSAIQKKQRLNAIIGYGIFFLLVVVGLVIHSDRDKALAKGSNTANTSSMGSTTSASNTSASNTTASNTSGSSTSSSASGLDSNGCYTPSTVRQHENTTGCVDFNVAYAYKDNAGTVFIDQLADYTEGVEVYIPYNADASDINYQQLIGKNIKATGPIQDYNGAPQVTVTELSQIVIYNN